MEHETGTTELLGREWFKREIYALDRLEEESQKKKEKKKNSNETRKRSREHCEEQSDLSPSPPSSQPQPQPQPHQLEEGKGEVQGKGQEEEMQTVNFSTPPSSRPLSQESQESVDSESQPVMSPRIQSPKRKKSASSSNAKRRRSIKETNEGKETKEKRKPSNNGTILQFFSKRTTHSNVCLYLISQLVSIGFRS